MPSASGVGASDPHRSEPGAVLAGQVLDGGVVAGDTNQGVVARHGRRVEHDHVVAGAAEHVVAFAQRDLAIVVNEPPARNRCRHRRDRRRVGDDRDLADEGVAVAIGGADIARLLGVVGERAAQIADHGGEAVLADERPRPDRRQDLVLAEGLGPGFGQQPQQLERLGLQPHLGPAAEQAPLIEVEHEGTERQSHQAGARERGSIAGAPTASAGRCGPSDARAAPPTARRRQRPAVAGGEVRLDVPGLAHPGDDRRDRRARPG